MKILTKEQLETIKVGDVVTRMLGGVVPMKLIVGEIDEKEDMIYIGKKDQGGWKFDRITGVEIDEDLGWTRESGNTGSYLIAINDIDEEDKEG